MLSVGVHSVLMIKDLYVLSVLLLHVLVVRCVRAAAPFPLLEGFPFLKIANVS